MATELTQTDQLRGGRIHLCELAGLEIRDCEVSGLTIVDCYGGDVSLGGDFGRVVVNDVDVTAYVEAELDRRHPARVLVREADSPADVRAAWDAIVVMWAETVERARLLGESALQRRVDGEWSFVETQRHLLFASDAWVGSAVLEEESPFHRWGYPAGSTSPEQAASAGLDLGATPTLDEVLAARAERMAVVRRLVDRLDEAELDRVCARRPAPWYADEEYVVRRCVRVVLNEEVEHHRYAARDLAVLQTQA
ncbi:DinB family protein [Nocardioides sp. GY 10113]|uniref:DinB family protein n=1 Tax=Nocardioides sp. GY 10113 TaxID=2569761 RepID=UPI0010A79657|nr:DinB family protein [Nocardioides sp. GY 10113]TIC87650.1 DinB family protein [Nocardioides sp. GY 10113]